MGLFDIIFGTRKQKSEPKRSDPVAVCARGSHSSSLDSISYSTEDADYWNFATRATADEIASPEARAKARNRCRYQYLNDPYAMNAARTLAVAVVGTGTKIQIVSVGGERKDEKLFEKVEDRYESWAKSIKLHDTVALMVRSLVFDGESFLRFVRNPKSPQDVSVDLIDAARVTSGWPTIRDDLELDGIRYDNYGNPREYTIISKVINPNYTNLADFEKVPESEIFHLFIKDLPEQHRGLPLLQSSLKTMAALRRYTMAVVEAAENVACLSFVIESQALPDQEAPAEWDAMDEIAAPRRGGTVLPRGWRGSQLKPEQPSQQHAEFMQTTLTGAGAGVGMPRNIFTNDSSGYNYSSGRLDHQIFFRYVETLQVLVSHLYSFTFRSWYQFDKGSQSLLKNAHPNTIDVRWDFEGLAHVDPKKEADAASMLRDKGMLTDEEYFGKRGQDWREQYHQMAEEQKLRKELGLELEEKAKGER